MQPMFAQLRYMTAHFLENGHSLQIPGIAGKARLVPGIYKLLLANPNACENGR